MTKLSEIDARIKLILAEVPGITRIYQKVPRTLNDVDMPSIVVILQDRTSQRIDASAVLHTRRWELQLFFDDMNSGDEGELETYAYNLDLFESINIEFEGRTMLQLNDMGLVRDSEIGIDTGLSMIQYPQGSENYYLGAIFTLTTNHISLSPMKG